ncbi:MAG: AsnC family transcriptional regulator [Candidatus Woesearchaeota archaeon]|jgi:Lrp/AsnC family leucine-responsive transcriptional regulator
MDTVDKNLLQELIRNSRISMTHLAKKLKVSREVATYRLNRLKKERVILDFVTEINITQLGFISAAVFINIQAKRQKEFVEFLTASTFVSWVAELSGIWSFGFSIIGKTNEELDNRFLEIYNTFKEDIIDHRFTSQKKSLFFYEKYFNSLPEYKKNVIRKKDVIDEKDKSILQKLSQNSRIDIVELSKIVSLTAPAITQRIKKLEAQKYIEKYSIFVDVTKLGLFQYSIFVVNKNIDEKEKLVGYLSQDMNISFIAQYIGDPFLEFGLFVKDPYQLREKLQQIEEKFPHNRVIEVSLFQKEFVSVGLPECVFE